MSIYGATKGTELEEQVRSAARAEANGTMSSHALARLAKEQGLDDVADAFVGIADQEAVHAGLYAVLNGQYPQDFWELARAMQKAEADAEDEIMELAAKVRALGCDDAADEIEAFAAQEKGHGVILEGLLRKHAPGGGADL